MKDNPKYDANVNVGGTSMGVHNKVGKVGTEATTLDTSLAARSMPSSNGTLKTKPNMKSSKTGDSVLSVGTPRVGGTSMGK